MKNTGQSNGPGTALVVQRLSLIPEGAKNSALAIVDQFALAAPEFVDGSERLITDAEESIVDDHISAQVSDEIQNELKREIKEWDNKRLAVVRPINDLSTHISGLIKDGVTNRLKAIAIRQQKISDYRRKVREEELAAQREAERVLAEERRRIEEEARKREEEAEAAARKREEEARKLKTEAGRQRAAEDARLLREQAADDAARLREEAALVPESVAVATSAPSLSASTVAGIPTFIIGLCDACEAAERRRPDPKRECPHNKKLVVQWILAHFDEWHGVIALKPAGLNDMARKYKDTLEIPGLKFDLRDSFRSKARGR